MSEYEKKVTIKEIVDFFNIEQLTGDEHSLQRWTVVPDINRPGFELCGFFKPSDPRRIVIIGNKEKEFIDTMTEEQQWERFPLITDGLTPAIIITKDNKLPPILKQVAEKANFPILRTKLPTYRMMADIISYLDERLAPEDTLSGGLMSIHGNGVLLLGESGMGKSETELELIRQGHTLVSDDRVDIVHVHNDIIGHAPEIIRGLLEIRGIGIIDVEKMFGAAALTEKSKIDLVVKLVPYEPDAEYNRMGDEVTRYTKIMGTLIPTFIIPVSAGRNTAALIEAAVANFRLLKSGFNSTKEIRKRFERAIVDNAEAEDEVV